jgi:hypothetical protein
MSSVTLYRLREGVLETRTVRIPENEQPSNTIVGKMKAIGWRTSIEAAQPEPIRKPPVKSTIQFRNGSSMTIVGDRIVGIDIVGDVGDETNVFLMKIEEDRHFGAHDGEQTLIQPDEAPAPLPEHELVQEPTESS